MQTQPTAASVANDRYKPLHDHILHIQNQLNCSAAATFVIHNGALADEFYAGSYDYNSEIRPVQPSTRFNVASVRKSYLGLAVGLALHQGRISGLNDPISHYLDDLNPELAKGTTIRHLLTHTHGLRSNHTRSFPPGTGWEYNNVGINLLIRLIRKLFGAPLSDVMRQVVFEPGLFRETGWRKNRDEHLVWIGEEYAAEQGGEANLFVSARELAYWGYLHLNRGAVGGVQVVPREVTDMATVNQSPPALDDTLPRNGFAWWIQDKPRADSQIGSTVPIGSYQILGITGCACLVIPERQLVAARMLNHVGSNPRGYDYLEDIRAFGDIVLSCSEAGA